MKKKIEEEGEVNTSAQRDRASARVDVFVCDFIALERVINLLLQFDAARHDFSLHVSIRNLQFVAEATRCGFEFKLMMCNALFREGSINTFSLH